MIHLTKAFITLLLKFLVPLLLTYGLSVQAQNRDTSTNINTQNGKTNITIKNGRGNSFSLEYEGDITLSNDDKDVTAISRGGYLEVKKSAFGSRRRIIIEPDNSGRLIKKYYVGSSEERFESEGRKWLSEILLEVVRSSSLGAEKRVDRFYKNGGTNAVLNEVGQMNSDYVKSYYIKLLLQKNLKNSDLIAVLDVVGDAINSDHHRAEILKQNTKAFLITEGTTTAYISTAGQINSDHHKAEVLKKSIRDGAISQTQMKALFTIAEDIDSDHHKASVLLETLKSRSLSKENINLLISTSRRISSDHHKATVLKAALASPRLSENAYSTVLKSVSDISSDHHSASIFLELLDNDLNNTSLVELLELVNDNISSDHHKSTVLKKLIRKQNLDGTNLNAFLITLKGTSSDNHKAEVFKQLASKRFNDTQLTRILIATKSFGSDFHHASALKAFAPEVKQRGNEVKDTYRNACRGISSSSHYGSAIKAIQ